MFTNCYRPGAPPFSGNISPDLDRGSGRWWCCGVRGCDAVRLRTDLGFLGHSQWPMWLGGFWLRVEEIFKVQRNTYGNLSWDSMECDGGCRNCFIDDVISVCERCRNTCVFYTIFCVGRRILYTLYTKRFMCIQDWKILKGYWISAWISG